MATILPQHRRARIEFEKLTRSEVSDAIRDMRALGFTDHTIAQATGLSVEAVRRFLAERREVHR